MTIRLFIDASVLFSAAYSSTGASREIIRRALRDEVKLVVSQYVLDEARRNLARKAAEKVALFEAFLGVLNLEEIAHPDENVVTEVEAYTVEKDAPVVAAAISADVDYLVSLDSKHLVDVPDVAAKSGLKIVLPGTIVQQLRQMDEED